MANLDRAIETLRSRLLDARNPDGGWSYFSGGASRLEPTALAMLAFSTIEGDERKELLQRGCSFLRRSRRRDGLLSCGASPEVNMTFDAQAALALRRAAVVGVASPADHLAWEDLLRALAANYGSRLPLVNRLADRLWPDRRINRQDNELRGWPWVKDTFSWVEPTAWCVVAIKQGSSSSRASARVVEAERLLFDRCCRNGGWNYGNSNMLGQDLPAYVPTTAVALLALANHRERTEVTRSLEFLQANRLTERSGMALATALIALRRYGAEADDVAVALAERSEAGEFRGNNATRAIALCALAGGSDGHPAFAV